MLKKILLFTFLIMMSSLSFALNENNYFSAKNNERPTREISIIITEDGYYPERPVVFVGEKIKLFVTSTTNLPTCLIMKGKDIFLEAKMGKVSESTMYVDKAGEIEMYCPSSKKKSTMVVLEHPRDAQDRIDRQIAQEKAKNIKIWRPRDE